MPLDEAVKTILGANFTEAQIIDMVTPDVQTKLGATHVIRTKADDESYLASHVKQGVDAEIGGKIGELHQKYEDDIFEITGIRKKTTEKAYEFNKRLLKELKTKSDASGGDQALKDQIATLTETLTNKETEHATALTSVQQKAFAKQLSIVVKSEFDTKIIAVPAHISSDEDKQKYISTQKRILEQDFLSKYTPKEDNEGNIVYYIGDKLQSSTVNGKPLTASELIAAEYSTSFSAMEGKKQGGAGSGKDGIPADGFSTKEQVYAHLETVKGLTPLTKEFTDQARKLIKEHGII